MHLSKVVAALAVLSGFTMAAPAEHPNMAVQARGDWPDSTCTTGWKPTQHYASTQLTTMTPASCFSTPAPKTATLTAMETSTVCKTSTSICSPKVSVKTYLSRPVTSWTQTSVSMSVTTPLTASTYVTCETEEYCEKATKMVYGKPSTLKITNMVPYTSTMPAVYHYTTVMPKISTSCSTLYSSASSTVCPASTKTYLSVVTPPVKQNTKSTMSTPCPTTAVSMSSAKPYTKSTMSSNCPTTGASMSSGKPYTSIAPPFYPVIVPTPVTSSSAHEKSSSMPLHYPATFNKASMTSMPIWYSETGSATTESMATSTKASMSSNATSSWYMPTQAKPTQMSSSASTFAGVPMALSALAAVAFAMTAL